MKYLGGLILAILASCGKVEQILSTGETKLPIIPITKEQEESLDSLREASRNWAYYCEEGNVCFQTAIEDGDSLLFTSLLCFSGESPQCDLVRDFQDSSGKLWRSPRLKNNDPENSFSRDMALGTLVYLLKSKDIQLATSWLSYIRSHNNLLCEDATDGRCKLTSNLKDTMKQVYQYLGVADQELSETESSSLFLQASFTSVGYQLHLVGLHLLLRKLSSGFDDSLKSVASKLVEREPQNPFFQYLANNFKYSAELTLVQCPVQEPENKTQWAWQRSSEEMAWKNSAGTDCLFMTNLLLIQ